MNKKTKLLISTIIVILVLTIIIIGMKLYKNKKYNRRLYYISQSKQKRCIL